jgi:hypothetical protein
MSGKNLWIFRKNFDMSAKIFVHDVKWYYVRNFFGFQKKVCKKNYLKNFQVKFKILIISGKYNQTSHP